jgi:positive regulator of sigma E activity
MTDNGLVIKTEKGLAEVAVRCFEGCQNCSARSLCIGNKQNKGRLSVKNPLDARPGDEVKIQIPENRYSQALILLFGGLLLSLLLGLGGGYLVSLLFALPSLPANAFGLLSGLILGVSILARVFRQKNKDRLYPVIIDIINKGDCYGSA